jgi:hypothetical protein
MRMKNWICTALFASAAMGCGSDPMLMTVTPDVPVVLEDMPMVMTDVRQPETGTDAARPDARTDAAVPTDAATSRAGAACTMPDPMGGMDPACGDELVCVNSQTTPYCTGECTNNASQAMERTACGGLRSTCLTQGDDPMAFSRCSQSCSPAAMTSLAGACRAGFVCTGWWYTHAGAMPDSPGCFAFCTADTDCGGMGRICNTRTGACGTTGFNAMALPDGSPCNPSIRVTPPGEMTARNVECRGICFRIGTSTMEGICGSFTNTRARMGCFDNTDQAPRQSPTMPDNLGICLWRPCDTNADCRSPHICRYPENAMGMPVMEAQPTCDYPTMAQRMGIPAASGDGGTTTDGSTDGGSADAGRTDGGSATDASVTDVPAGG